MNQNEKLQLQKMIKANNVEDNTCLIRNLKHSKLIWYDVNTILNLKTKYANLEKENGEEFLNLCSNHANFLFSTYTDIFNKVVKNEINLDILLKLINLLKAIEEEACDQHEASFEVGKLLKSIYIDSALRKADKLDELNEENKLIEPEEQISWSEYKKKYN
jgi:hypothetical protein